MEKSEVVDFFGNESKTAKALGISRQAINKWAAVVPSNRLKHVQDAMELEQMKRNAEAKKKRRQRKECFPGGS